MKSPHRNGLAQAHRGDEARSFASRRWVSAKVAAAYLSLHVQTVYSLFYRGILPGTRIGRTVRIDLRGLDDALDKKRETK